MDENREKKIKKSEKIEKYGEFVPSYFEWITLDKQRKRTEELENITKKNK